MRLGDRDVLKMLDQGNTNAQGQPTIAVLFGTASPLRVELTITDTSTGAVKTYVSPFNTGLGGTDFTAFVKSQVNALQPVVKTVRITL